MAKTVLWKKNSTPDKKIDFDEEYDNNKSFYCRCIGTQIDNLAILKIGAKAVDKSTMSNRSSFLQPHFVDIHSDVFEEDGEDELKNFLDGLESTEDGMNLETELILSNRKSEPSSTRYGRNF